ncbi:MAG: Sir2 family NAD+-dependent deacetylase [Aeromonas sp.]
MAAPYQHIVILTGAGISAESGIKTFRASDGLWEEHRVEDVATPEGYARDPKLVIDFYNARRAQLNSPSVQPNLAHYALARLEQRWPGIVTLVTQNIDDLHERGGSQHLIHMHGELFNVRCPTSGQVIPWRGPLQQDDRCRCCEPAQPLRPDIVWFGEMPIGLDAIYQQLAQCDLFISIGTSGAVYPAAGFVQEARLHGAHTIELNLEPSEVGSQFAEKRYDPASLLVPAYVDELLAALP